MRFSTLFRRTLISSLVTSVFIPSLSSASGFALIETNARGQGNAYAGAAAHTPDASTIFFNPAGMMNLNDDQLVVASHLIVPTSSFKNDGSTSAPLVGGSPLTGDDNDGGFNAIVPNLYWVAGIDEKTKFGLGVYAPFGLATKYDDDWVGRYHGVISDLQIINFNPSFAYQVDDQLSIGGGLDIMFGAVELSSAVDFGAICVASFNAETCAGLGALPQQADGYAHLEGDNFDSISIGFNLGLLYQISDQTNLGMTYRSEVDMDIKGDADYTVPSAASFVYASNAFIDTGLSATVSLPSSISISLSHQVDKFTYLADITWTGWSSFQELRVSYDNANQPDTVTTENWNDVMRYSFGADYQYSNEMVLRAGVALDESPVPSAERRTPRLPGSDRTWLSFGASYKVDNDISVDFGYTHLTMADAPVNNEYESGIPTLAATVSGEYDAAIDIFSVQLNWNY